MTHNLVCELPIDYAPKNCVSSVNIQCTSCENIHFINFYDIFFILHFASYKFENSLNTFVKLKL